MKLIVILLLLLSNYVLAQSPQTIVTGSEKDFIPEGIAIDGRDGSIYISSINLHKIVRVKNGKTSDFIVPNQNGFMEGLGMRIDEKRNWLWAVSIAKEDSLYHSKVHAFNIADGKTMQQYELKDTNSHLLNDLVIDKSGNLFITDTYFSAVYKIDPMLRKFDLFIKSSTLDYPNGISSGNGLFYIATYDNGIVALDTISKTLTKLNGISDTAIAYGLDGLLFHDNSLIGVYNTGDPPGKNCIIRYKLSANGLAILSEKILAAGHPSFADPTTVAVYKNKIYTIANSHLDDYNKNNTSTKGIEHLLRPVTIYVQKLK